MSIRMFIIGLLKRWKVKISNNVYFNEKIIFNIFLCNKRSNAIAVRSGDLMAYFKKKDFSHQEFNKIS